MEQHGNIHIPHVLKNSYNLRLADDLSRSAEPFNYGQDWPSTIDVLGNNSVPVHNCPSRMHQVIWGQNDSMVLRLFPRSKASLLMPVFGTHEELRHHPVYTGVAFPSSIPPNFPRYAEVVLEKDHFVFIPETYLVGLGTLSADHIRCLRMCFVDASNLKAFKEELSIDAVISPHARNVLQQLSDPSRDLTMKREPKDFTLGKILVPGDAQFLDELSEEMTTDVEQQSRGQRKRRLSTGKFRGIGVLWIVYSFEDIATLSNYFLRCVPTYLLFAFFF